MEIETCVPLVTAAKHTSLSESCENIDKLLLKIPEVVQATGYSRSFIYEAIAAGSRKE
tara:strand:+ start:398 stop:571 length:174 start_codon:yes stop_codon:yes gene_type:complete